MPDGFSIVPTTSVKAGTRLIADGGFTCLKDGEVVTVQADEGGELYVPCEGGSSDEHGAPATEHRNERHYLDGQLDADGENYIGFWLAE